MDAEALGYFVLGLVYLFVLYQLVYMRVRINRFKRKVGSLEDEVTSLEDEIDILTAQLETEINRTARYRTKVMELTDELAHEREKEPVIKYVEDITRVGR